MEELSADLAIHGGTLIHPDRAETATVLVSDGRITGTVPAGTPYRAGRDIDATGLYVLPGLIDSHVHFRTPGLTHKETWATGSRAAAAGGVTTVIDMPNTRPPLFDPVDAKAKSDLIEGTSLVDYLFHLGVDGERPELIENAAEARTTSAKIFMAGHHTAPNVVRDLDQLDRAFAAAARAGVRVLLHAEDDHLFEMLDQWRGSVHHVGDMEPARPRSGAISAAGMVIRLVERHGTATHVLHVSSAEEMDLYAAAAHAGLPITVEVTGHHLSFSDHDVVRLGTRIRLSPAIRQPADRDRLWQAVLDGQVRTLGSDHAPHTLAEKAAPIADAPPGLPGVQELPTAFFTGLRRRQPDRDVTEHLSLMTRVLAANPADLFGLTGTKGRLTAGHDADIVLFDPATIWALDARDVQAKVGWSAYEGWQLIGKVVRTLRRGRDIYDATTGTFGDPDGRWLRGVRS